MKHTPAPGAAISGKPVLSDETAGMLLGLVGVAMFSLTLPFTRMAVAELDPAFVALARALVAAVLGAIWLRFHRAAWPPRSALLPLALVSLGCVIGFPWLTSIALRTLPASHGAVLVGILPLATAVFSALRGVEKPSARFWVTALLGSSIVIGFALRQSGGNLHPADLLMLGAVVLGALGYAEGGHLARTMGGPQVISWALVLSAPLLLPLVLWLSWPWPGAIAGAGIRAWLGFAYVAVFSMFIGFVFWYRGMALGGIARVGQVQLIQPFLTLLGAAALLGEPLVLSNFVFALAVIALVALGRKMQVRRVALVRMADLAPAHGGQAGGLDVQYEFYPRQLESSMSIYQKLNDLNITLSAPATPAAAYVMYVQTGNLVFISGHIAKHADGTPNAGQLGKNVTTEQGQQAARAIAIDLVGTLQEACGGDLTRVKRIVKLMSLVNSTADFTEQHLVTNGASELLGELFGDAGKHARSAFGVAQIPRGACVEIEMIVEVA
ncbi:hypothetical protein GCM10008020_15260 [Massilia psychrophila]|nr:hypothetical protein GCM10008020_15260 [Massilia psychrophila]